MVLNLKKIIFKIKKEKKKNEFLFTWTPSSKGASPVSWHQPTYPFSLLENFSPQCPICILQSIKWQGISVSEMDMLLQF